MTSTAASQRKTSISKAMAALATTALVSAAAPPSAPRCDVAALQAAAPRDTTILAAEWLTSPVRHCRVDGYVTTTNPGPNRNNFRLQLPEPRQWNHRYYFIGVGGSGGSVPTESQIPPGNPIVRGFAVAGTDKGHQTAALDWSFSKDPAKALDNAHRGAHVTTVAAQQLTRAFYGASSMYRYHTGCSGGGDMGMKAMQLHPGDYDGVLLGWSGGRHPDPSKDGPAANFSMWVRAISRERGAWPSPAKLAFVEGKVVEACDTADGTRDELIWDNRQCRFDFATLACPAGGGADCLTPAEVRTFTTIARDTTATISNIAMWAFYLGRSAPPWSASPAIENAASAPAAYIILNGWARTQLNQPDRDIIKQPLTSAEVARIIDGQTRDSGSVPGELNDIRPFLDRGGKAIFFVGSSDPIFPKEANESYFQGIGREFGAARVEGATRLYEVPGWGHCGGGTGPSDGQDAMLQALIHWVEQGQAPSGITMHRGSDRARPLFTATSGTVSGVTVPPTTGASRDFLVCPYPMTSVFDQSKANMPGAVYESRNWSCRRTG